MNFLLITTDQQRWDAVGYNNPSIKTPNIDRLAQKGIAFNRAYCPHAVCTPSRVSMLTGHYASKHGAYTVGCNLTDGYPTVPEIFSKNNYFTSLIGKAHFKSCCTRGSFEALPNVHDTAFFRNWTGPYFGFDYCKLAIGHGTEAYCAGMHYRVFLEDNGIDPNLYFGEDKYAYPSSGAWDLPEEFHYSKWTADESIKAIDLAEKEEKPFFLWTSFQDPHNPCWVPEPWASMHDPADMPEYKRVEREFANKPPIYQWLVDHPNPDDGYTADDPWLNCSKPWYTVRSDEFHKHGAETQAGKKQIAARYYGMVSLMDHHLGRILDHLEAKGLMDDTVIVFTSDHGEYLGNHGLWWKGLPAFEDSQKVPFVVYHPQCQTTATRSDSLQNLIDIGQTFLDIAGIGLPPGLQGETQTQAWVNNTDKVRKNTILEFRPTESPFMQKTFITDQYKIVFYNERESWGELYDLKTDPDQYDNLWNNPARQTIKNKLIFEFISAEMQKEGTLHERTMWA